jgi:hypothetical protein
MIIQAMRVKRNMKDDKRTWNKFKFKAQMEKGGNLYSGK